MNIAGLQKITLIDYPNKIACTFFIFGCNFKCGFCHNPELVIGKNIISNFTVEECLDFLKRKKDYLEGVCISGGEPTLQNDLPDFVKKIKKLGLSVKIDTNGSNPEMLKRLLEEGNVNYVAMDIKAPKQKYNEVIGCADNNILENLDKSIKIIKKFPVYEFRTTVLPFFNKQDFEKIGEWISNNRKEKVKIYTLQNFNPQKTLDSKYGKMIPKTKKEIEDIAELMKKYAEEVRVLGLD